MKTTFFPSKILFLVLFFLSTLNTSTRAQFNVWWSLTKNNSVSFFSGSINPQGMQVGSQFLTNGGYSNAGYKCQPVTIWSQHQINGYHLDFPLSPNSGYDITLTDLKDTSKTSGGSGTNVISLAYQIDGIGGWIPFGTPQTSVAGGTSIQSFTGLNQTFFNGHTYIIRMFVYATDSLVTSKSRSVTIKGVTIIGTSTISGTPPSITSDSIIQASITKYNATATGTIVAGTIPALQSGVCWNANGTNPTLADAHTTYTGNSLKIGLGTGGDINGLQSGVKYCYRAYVTTSAGTIYGDPKVCFTTLAPTAPIITTNPISVLSSVSVSGGGTITDSGGAPIIVSGLCWNNTGNPTANDFKTVDGNSNTFNSLITGLLPCTKYYVRAYAINSIDTSYGSTISFTTACVPSLLATPAVLNFGNVPITTSATLSYTLTGALLSPSNGSITIQAPTGFLIYKAGSTPATSLTIPYTSGALPATTIYVTFSSNQFGIFNDSIIHAGGGVVPPNVQQVIVHATASQSLNSYSNSGIDFWTGFGYLAGMASKEQDISVYISAANQDANVSVTLPNLPGAASFNALNSGILVKAGTVLKVTGFPISYTNGNADCRLYYTGVSNKGIHITSDNGVPVSVWTYTNQLKNDAAAGCLNFPTNTWNTSYTVQSFAGLTNNSNPFPYFFVIAKDDSTEIKFVPTTNVIDSSAAGVTKDNYLPLETLNSNYLVGDTITIKLNKGQVFNALAYIQSKSFDNRQYDLSGTKVWSTSCDKKIAVFGGNGRCTIGTSQKPISVGSSGSDNMMQQMFPTVAWGDEYLTVPTKTMENNLYRVYVLDTATIVSVNGDTLPKSTLINNAYYQIDQVQNDTLNHPNRFVGNKAISVTQFITSQSTHDATVGNNGVGDPEMITLSPIKQAINSVTVYSPSLKNNKPPGGNYINVIIPKQGVSSFKIYSDTIKVASADSVNYIDPNSGLPFYLRQLVFSNPSVGTNTFNFCYKMFNDTNILLVDTGSSSFNGIAYASDTNLIPVDSAFKPHPLDSNYYYAKFRVAPDAQYTLTSKYGFNAIAYGMDQGESYGFNAGTNLNIINIPPGQPQLGTHNDSLPHQYSFPQQDPSVVNTCAAIPFHFTLALSYKPDSLIWDFSLPNGTSNSSITPNTTQHQIISNKLPNGHSYYDTIQKFPNDTSTYYVYSLRDAAGNIIPFKFSSTGTYTVNVNAYIKQSNTVVLDPCTVVQNNGETKNPYKFTIKVTKGVHPNFTNNYKVCQGDTIAKVVFTDSTTDENQFPIIARIWNFGNGKYDSLNNATKITSAFPKSGVYPIKLTSIDTIGCLADTTIPLTIAYKPIVKFSNRPDTICAGSNVLFIDSSSIVDNAAFDKLTTWQYIYGGVAGSKTYSDSSRHNWTYLNAGTYGVSLTVSNAAGCSSTFNNKDSIVVQPIPTANFTIPFPLDTARCKTYDSLRLSDASSSTNPKYPITNWIWDFGNSTSSNSKNPTAHYLHNGTYQVKLHVVNAFGCGSAPDATASVRMAYNSKAQFTPSTINACIGIPVSFVDASTNIDPSASIKKWIWDFKGYGNKQTVTTSTQQNQVYDSAKIYTVSLQVVNDSGCISNQSSIAINVQPTPLANIILPGDACLPNATVSFANASSISDNSALKFIWNFGNGLKTDTIRSLASQLSTYSNSGPFTVSLNAFSQYGCANNTSVSYDNVYATASSLQFPFSEGFEMGNFPPNYPDASGGRWRITQDQTPDNLTWQRTTSVTPSEKTACAWINNLNPNSLGKWDDINTPSYTLPQSTGIYDSLYLKFDISASPSNTSKHDSLQVWISTDCGATWDIIYTKSGTTLQTMSAAVAPSSLADWRTDSINLTSIPKFQQLLTVSNSQVRFKFRSINHNETNIYLDNIHVYKNTPIGSGYYLTTDAFADSLNIIHNYPPANLKSLVVYNMLGQPVYKVLYHGNAPIPIILKPGYNGLEYLPNGMYIIVMEYTNKAREVHKIMKQQ